MIIPADIRQARWQGPRGKRGTFRPNGTVQLVGARTAIENPAAWSSDEPLQAARLFVGFNVGAKPRWKLDDLVRVVKRARKAQGHAPDASFLVQKGIYTRKSGETVTEDGAQVVVLNTEGDAQPAFQREMVELAEAIATTLKQEEVILELQRGGVVQRTFGVVP